MVELLDKFSLYYAANKKDQTLIQYSLKISNRLLNVQVPLTYRYLIVQIIGNFLSSCTALATNQKSLKISNSILFY